MKYSILFLPFLIGMTSCGPGEDAGQARLQDSLLKDSLARRYCVETLLDIGSESELIARYGADHVEYDTLWGAEGFYTMGTTLKTDKVARVEIMWMDSARRAGMISATLVSEYDGESGNADSTSWKSCAGLKLGMTLEEVQNINGRPFEFSGFGWDYGGGLMSWQEGKLEAEGIHVQFAEGTGAADLTEQEYEQVIGDVPVSSENKTARKLNTRVWSISVADVR